MPKKVLYQYNLIICKSVNISFTSGNVSNFVKLRRKQNNCIEILDDMTNRHIVKIMRLPNFFPGPNILYTKSSSIGDALISLTTLRT